MRFTCKRARLAEVAGLVGQAVASKTTKRIFECLRLSTGEGLLEVQGTDLEVAVRYRLGEVEVKEAGEAVVPAPLFSGVMREIADESVTVAVARQKMSIQTDGGSFEIQCEDPAQYPEIPAFPKMRTGAIAPEDLRALVRKTAFAAGKEAARFVLNGVRILAAENNVRFVATDGRRLATLARPLEGRNADEPVRAAIVGVRALQHVERIAAESESPVDLAVEERFVSFRTTHAEVTTRVMDGIFPNYEEILPKESRVRASVPVGMLASRLRQAEQFAAVESKAVVLAFRPGELTITAAGGEGRAEVRVGIEYDGSEEKIGFNPAFVLDCLKVVDGENATIALSNRNAAATFSDDSGFLYVLMPVLID